MAASEIRGHEEDWRQRLLRRIEVEMSTIEMPTEPLANPAANEVDKDVEGSWIPSPSGRDGTWHRRDFAAVDPQEFVRTAYRTLLGREADPDGQAAYEAWRGAWLGRAALLQQLADSPEGRQRDVRLVGCRLAYWLWRVSRGPLRGLFNRLLLSWDAEAWMQGLYRQLRKYVDGATERLAREVQTWRAVDLGTTLLEHQRALNDLRQEVEALRALAEELKVARTDQQPQRAAPRADDDELEEEFYVAFEDACRGDTLQLWVKLEPYLAELPPAPARVVDLGCGRGEWLQLLQGRGYTVLGVEPSGAMVQRCREARIPVVQGEGLSWLHAQGEASVDVLTAFQVAEHLPFGELLAWLREAARVLKPGGKLILETPNPENVLVGSHTFYHDPTHRNPLTPTLLQFAFGYCGLRVDRVLRVNPYPPEAKVPGDDPLTARVNGHLCGPQDFAVIGVRP
ncbi:methyltransferase domain-containing protein [Tepidimonas taiwanensis]|uniref:methyltransferase domain-containing protein n=1 Tax=Tepidimonas taiwanensis TaxID=307486 RepID=UPI00073421FF|nr:methyltransferase domain-containing protein [Tepidimonas taiwanensis]